MTYRTRSRQEQIKLLKEKSLEEIKQVYRPLVTLVAEKYVEDLPLEEGVEIALGAIETARRLYLKGLEKKRSFKFDTYATWFFKRAIEDHLGISDDGN